MPYVRQTSTFYSCVSCNQLQVRTINTHWPIYLFIYSLHRKDVVKRKPSSGTKQKSSKILVRNVPFEATQKELRELFGTFGELKTVRLPKFIDFLTKQDAKVSKVPVMKVINVSRKNHQLLVLKQESNLPRYDSICICQVLT